MTEPMGISNINDKRHVASWAKLNPVTVTLNLLCYEYLACSMHHPSSLYTYLKYEMHKY